MLDNFNQYELTTEVKISRGSIGVFVRDFDRQAYVILELDDFSVYTLSSNFYRFIESITDYSVIRKIIDAIAAFCEPNDLVSDKVEQELSEWFYQTFGDN